MQTVSINLNMRAASVLAFFTFGLATIGQTEASQLPSSPRSDRVEANHRTHLENAFRQAGAQLGTPIYIRIFKETSELELWIAVDDKFELFKTYPICTFSGRLGPKLREGDNQSPEGFYYVTPARMNPWSRFHLSFNLGFPNAYDRHHGRTGSYLMVHGNCVSIGCYAMTNARIEEIYSIAAAALRAGQPFFRVHVFPFRMATDRTRQEQGSRWYGFWQNLKEGYDWFEAHRTPPDTQVQNGRYVFRLSE